MPVQSQVLLHFVQAGDADIGDGIFLAVGHGGLQGGVQFAPGNRRGARAQGLDHLQMGGHGHGADLHSPHVGRAFDHPLAVREMPEAAVLAPGQRPDARLFRHVLFEPVAQRAVQHLIGDVRFLEQIGNGKNRNVRIEGGQPAFGNGYRLNHAPGELLQHGLLCAQSAVGINADLDVAAGSALHFIFKNHQRGMEVGIILFGIGVRQFHFVVRGRRGRNGAEAQSPGQKRGKKKTDGSCGVHNGSLGV